MIRDRIDHLLDARIHLARNLYAIEAKVRRWRENDQVKHATPKPLIEDEWRSLYPVDY
jgi:hypothetical protein